MKRASVIAPLVLILIGILFLLNNLRPDLSITRVLGEFWPWILIAWGLIRIAEIFAWRAQDKPLPAAGISGGEWGFILVVCFLGWSFNGWQSIRFPSGRFANWGWQMVGESHEFPVAEGKVNAGDARRLVIENLRGNVRINPVDGAGISFAGRKSIRAFDRARAVEIDQKTPLKIERQGDAYVLRTNQERWMGEERISADLEITAPKNLAVECRARYGDFDITGMSGGVSIDSDNAGVRLQDIAGAVKINVRRSDQVRAVNVQGPVTIDGRGEDVDLDNIAGPVTMNFSYTGELRFRNLAKPLRFASESISMLAIEQIPGSLRLARGEMQAENIVGPSVMNMRSKDVRVREFSGPLEVRLQRGDLMIEAGNRGLGAVDARTSSGAVELALPPGARFDLVAESSRGDVTNDFGAPLSSLGQGRGGQVTGSTGPGAPSIRVRTERGDVLVRRATGALPPSEQQ
jgi:DUF4097 and DUF4098 domain-containing protein YvlB